MQVSKGEAEIIMTMVTDVANAITKRDVDVSKIQIDSDREIKLKTISIAAWIIAGILMLGGISGIMVILQGKPEIGIPVISSTITGALGFLAGKTLSK